jgi:hypothetical protein
MMSGFQPITGSSNVAGAGYDEDTRTLTVKFHSGKSYTFANVPESIYQGLLDADSAGKYFNAHIKDKF